MQVLSFADAVAAAPGPVRFVKLDCEGGEYQMAYQSKPEDWASVERVVLEYHDVPGESWSDLRAWFAGVGLHLVALNVLYPKLVGGQLQLNPLAGTLALLVWSWLWGPMGLILGIPITAAIKIVCDQVASLRPYGAWLGIPDADAD